MSIDQIPPEVFAIIFKQLGNRDKLNARFVCKKWNSIVENLKEDCLVISNVSYVNDHWFHSNVLVTNEDRIYILNQLNSMDTNLMDSSLMDSASFGRLLFLPRFTNLKKLYICFVNFSNSFKFDYTINHFKQLQQLDCTRIQLAETESCLDLPRLDTLSIVPLNNMIRIKLITPTLRHLKLIFKYNDYEIVHRDSIIYLEGDEYDPLIGGLINLECLVLRKYDGFTLDNLEKLKFVHDIGYFVLGFRNLQIMRRMNEKKHELNRNDLTLYICGLEYEIFARTFESNPGSNLTPFYSRHYDNLIDHLPWEDKFFFNRQTLPLLLAISMDSDLKFPNIKHIYCDKLGGEEQLFINFLTCYPHLDRLNLHLSFANVNNYHSLPIKCPYITHLECFTSNGCEVDLEFIYNFKYLNHFNISDETDLLFIESTFKRLKYLKDFRFIMHRSFKNDELHYASINKNCLSQFRWSYKNYQSRLYETLKQVLEDHDRIKENSLSL